MADGDETPATKLPPVLNIIAIAGFAASLSTRSLDPVLPHVASDFHVDAATAAWLSAVTALTFSVIQPLLGAAADLFGKARLMIVCLSLLGAANLLGALAPSYSVLFAARILSGIGTGGVFPIALGLTGDLVPPDRRQVAIGRILGASMAGNLLGATTSGLIGDVLGWRGVLTVLGLSMVVASLAVAFGLRGGKLSQPTGRPDVAALKRGYRTIFANSNAAICFGAVFVEGCCVLGVLPFVASFLFEQGETRVSIAGLVIAGFAVGGLSYTLCVSWLLPRLRSVGLMIGGALIVAAQLGLVALGLRWQVQAVIFIAMGFGFYMLHGCLQVFATELSEEARATAMALHSCFFFLGQTAGPIAYGIALVHLGKSTTLIAAGGIIVALGLVCARYLKTRPPADATR